MIEEEITHLLAQAKTFGDKPLEIRPATEEEITEFERMHSMKFSDETKKWFLLLPLAAIRESVLKLTRQRMGGEAKRPNIFMGKPICSNQV